MSKKTIYIEVKVVPNEWTYNWAASDSIEETLDKAISKISKVKNCSEESAERLLWPIVMNSLMPNLTKTKLVEDDDGDEAIGYTFKASKDVMKTKIKIARNVVLDSVEDSSKDSSKYSDNGCSSCSDEDSCDSDEDSCDPDEDSCCGYCCDDNDDCDDGDDFDDEDDEDDDCEDEDSRGCCGCCGSCEDDDTEEEKVPDTIKVGGFNITITR